MVTVLFVDDTVTTYEADGWRLFRAGAGREVTFTNDVELRKGDTPVAVIGAGTFKSIQTGAVPTVTHL